MGGMTPIPITLTATFTCPNCHEVVTVENPIIDVDFDVYWGIVRVKSAVTCPHCGEEYEGEAK